MKAVVSIDSSPEFVRRTYGELVYDLAFVDLTDECLSLRHDVPVKTIRKLRLLPELQKIRKQLLNDPDPAMKVGV